MDVVSTIHIFDHGQNKTFKGNNVREYCWATTVSFQLYWPYSNAVCSPMIISDMGNIDTCSLVRAKLVISPNITPMTPHPTRGWCTNSLTVKFNIA